MKLPRPYIPLAVRCEVAERQLRAQAITPSSSRNLTVRLVHALAFLFGSDRFELDHDPPLAVRLKTRRGKFVPDANDPDYLVYRLKDDHGIKTRVRGDHGQYSDLALIKREKRRHRPKRPSRKIQSASRWPPRGSRKVRWR